MTKIVLIILAIYVIYYAGNILYDVLFAKNASVKVEDLERVSIHEFVIANRTEPEVIGIEDVENLQTPKSFSKSDFNLSTGENGEELQDIDYWRGLFESEQSIDAFNEEKSLHDIEEDLPLEEVNKTDKNKSAGGYEPLNSSKIQNREEWHQLMNFAETTVQLISNENGHKIYHSSAF